MAGMTFPIFGRFLSQSKSTVYRWCNWGAAVLCCAVRCIKGRFLLSTFPPLSGRARLWSKLKPNWQKANTRQENWSLKSDSFGMSRNKHSWWNPLFQVRIILYIYTPKFKPKWIPWWNGSKGGMAWPFTCFSFGLFFLISFFFAHYHSHRGVGAFYCIHVILLVIF
jgi:hypothetical protein